MEKEVKSDPREAFRVAYTALNPAQKRAVDAIEGPVMVIAGPGTGKTQILALRIANILDKTDTAPSSILALTFTEAGVASMRARLAKLMGARGYQVRIHTFHGFCNTVIKRYPERFPRIIGSEQTIDIDSLKLIESLIDTGSYTLLRPVNYPYYYVREIKSTISDVKRENVSPDKLHELIAASERALLAEPELYHQKGAHAGKMKGVYADALKKLEKAREFERVYRTYEDALVSAHLYDFEDTILEVVRALEADAELKLMLQEEHQYVLADEHQDANGAQNRLLELLSDFYDAPNLFVVGDEKQAIYRFQGASLANFLYFREHYSGAQCIELESNYRSTQVILDAAHDVIVPTAGHESIPRPRLSAEAAHAHAPVSLVVAPQESHELANLANTIEDLLASGTPGAEIVVLARRNADVATVARILKKRGIAVSSANDEQVLSIPLIRSFIQLLRAVAYFGEDYALYPLLYAPYFAIPNLDIYRLTEKQTERRSLFETLASEKALRELGIEDAASCAEVFSAVNDIATYAKDAPLADSVDFAFERSGIAKYLFAKEDRHMLLEAFTVFLRYVTQMSALHPRYGMRELLQALDTAEEYGLSLFAQAGDTAGAVRVATVHKAKGLEYDHVFVPFAHDGRWGQKSSRAKISLPLYATVATEDEVLDDERRLLYVAMTRARKSLTFSYAEVGDDGRMQTPSRFLADIGEVHVAVQTLRSEDLSEEPTLMMGVATQGVDAEKLLESERAYIRTRLATQGMSVSALNNFLDSPWRYFFQNLLRVPARREPHQLFGTAMDSALKLYTRMEAEGTLEGARVLSEFERVLALSPFREVDRESYRARGLRALEGYLGEYAKGDGGEKRAVDAGVQWSVLFETGTPTLPEITLRGEYDRVEFLDSHTVRVVDFKTGTPKSRNYIEGGTKDSNGNYKRQLVFYALLASLDPVRNWQVTEGVIDFVEPDEKGKYHREVFPISQSDIDALKEVVQRAVEDILEFAFFDQACLQEDWSKEGALLVEAYKSRFG